jgi:hypothetical protein
MSLLVQKIALQLFVMSIQVAWLDHLTILHHPYLQFSLCFSMKMLVSFKN